MKLETNYFFVGAIHGEQDQTSQFIEKGIWELGWFERGGELNPQYKKMLYKYNQMKVGDKIVIKSTYTRKNNLPFNIIGAKSVSVMMLKAYGTITQNVSDGHTLMVNWDTTFKPREWYFYTGRETIWEVSNSNNELSEKLIDFVNGANQDYGWFLSQPFWSKYLNCHEDFTPFLPYDELAEVLMFFVKTAQLKILTKVDPTKSTASDFYHVGDNRVVTINNALGLHRDAWRENIATYTEAKEEWFSTGVECIHFSNGSAQTRNYSWRNASIHLSVNHRYAIEFMFGMDGPKGDNLIHSLEARLFNLYDENGNHTTNKNSYTSTKADEILFSIPVSISLKASGEVDKIDIALTQDNYDILLDYLSKSSTYFTNSDKIASKGANMDTSYINRYSKTLLNSNNVIFRGAPGTGKSYLAKSIAADIITGGDTDRFDELSKEQLEQVEFVQFHPSYDYTDFVEGLRPKSNADGSIGFKLEPGVFKRFVSKARQNQDDASGVHEKPYIFIIDEINRGEISKIFGELFFSIDPGYRGSAGAVSTQYANLHHEDENKFYVPNNVYIIGTMNDIDRSVDSFDFAMRRRFRFINIKAEDHIAMLDILTNKDEAQRRMNSLNKAISNVDDLNENYHIGASYFLKLQDIDFDSLWYDYLAPLLHDYVRGLYNEMELLSEFKKAYDIVDDSDDH